MRNKRFFTIASFGMTVLLSALISIAATMCFAETFQLDCSVETVTVFCCAAAVLAAFSMAPRHRWILFTAEILILCGVALWQLQQLKAGFQVVLLRVTTQFAKDFPVSVMGSSEGEALWFLLPLGLLISWVTAWVCNRKGSALPVGLICAPVLVCCLLTVGIAPIQWLVVLTGGLVMLVVSQSVRRQDPKQGNLLAWKLLMPMALALLLPLLVIPPEEYVRSEWSDQLLTIAKERLGVQEYQPDSTIVIPSTWKRQLKTVNLQRVGPKSKAKAEVLRYRADTFISYLRGVSLGVYENNCWSAVDPYLYAEQGLSGQNQISGKGPSRTLNLYTKNKETLLYTTYFLEEIPESSTAIDDAYLENSQHLTEYAIHYSKNGRAPTFAYSEYVKDVYTQLPGELKSRLVSYSRENNLMGVSAERIASHVKSSGIYDLNTPRIPSDEDFVLYFLEESHRGYCVHFASATVLLLRVQGIPARYVTGYAVDGNIGQRNIVTADQSHAWVEYFMEGVGWRVLDPTPSDLQENEDPANLPDMEEPPTQPVTPEPPEETELPETPEENQPDQQEPSMEVQPEKPLEDEPVVNIPLPDILKLPGSAGEGSTETPPLKKQIQIPAKILWWIAGTVLAVAVLQIQRIGRLKWHRHCCTVGSPNRQALVRWYRLSALYQAVGMKMDAKLSAVAQKARFSQYTVSSDELRLLEQAAAAPIEKLKQAPVYKRFWYRYIRVLF